MKKFLVIITTLILVLVAGIFVLLAPAIGNLSKAGVVDVNDNLKVFTGGGNSAVYVTPFKSAIIIVDTKFGGASKTLKQYTDSVNPKAKVTIINTHLHADHVGGDSLYPGAEVIMGGGDGVKTGNLADRVIKPGESYVIKIDGDEIIVRNMGVGHSFADMVVYFKNEKLLMTGDLVFNGWHPVLIKQGGADIGKWVKDLEFLQANYDAKTVVPGHGEVSGGNILQEQKEYFEGIKAALTDPEKMKALKEKYKGYNQMPFFTGVDRTAEFMKSTGY